MAQKTEQSSRKRRDRKDRREKSDFEQSIIDIARVTRVVAGGRRFSFRAAVAVGNRKGRVGFGVAKGSDVTIAVNKAVNKAKKNMVDVPIVRHTIPHDIRVHIRSAEILLRPAKEGSGVVAGGAVRIICDLAGITNIVGKIYRSTNPVNNAYAVIEAFRLLEGKRSVLRRRGIEYKEKGKKTETSLEQKSGEKNKEEKKGSDEPVEKKEKQDESEVQTQEVKSQGSEISTEAPAPTKSVTPSS